MSWWVLYTLAATVWIVLSSVVILLQRRPAASTIAWLMVFVFLPVIGLLAYRLIGPLKLERKKRRRSNARRIIDQGARGMAALREVSAEDHQLAMISVALDGAPPLPAQSLDLYLDGVSTYAAILEAVGAARHHVNVEYYIWEDGEIGRLLRDALIERAKAGVQVRVLLDGTGTKLSKKFLQPLREAGAKVAWFNPVRLFKLRRARADFRTHRKIVVVDGAVGFTGGMNISDLHSAKLSPDTYWRDTHLRMTGVAVWPLQRVFFEDWLYAAEELIPVDEKTVPPAHGDGGQLVQIVAAGPDASSFAIHKVFFAAINHATERVWLTTPYFVPDEALLTALITAALRGVDVRVLIPKKGDSKLLDLAARSYIPELLETKVKVFEYEPRFIHAKTMVCDDDIAIIGTANFDNRSFRLDFELAAVVYAETMNLQLARAFEVDCSTARELLRKELKKLSFARRLGEASARLLSPLL